MITARPGREGGRAVGRRDREKPPDAVRLTRDASGASAATSPRRSASTISLGMGSSRPCLPPRWRARPLAEAAPLQYVRARMHRIAWDDLRYVLAVAEAGSLAAAARTLGVSHTTVLRRVGGFEAGLGLRLFERLPTGYALTAGGEELVAAARSIDGIVTALERKLASQDLRLVGTLRLTTTDTLMASVLPPVLAAFRAEHPGIGLEIGSNLMANLTKRDADGGDPPGEGRPRRWSAGGSRAWSSPSTGPRATLRAATRSATSLGRSGLGPTIAWRGPAWRGGCAAPFPAPASLCGPILRGDAPGRGRGAGAHPRATLGDTSDGLRRIWPPGPELATELWC